MRSNNQEATENGPDLHPAGQPGNTYGHIAISGSSRAHLGNSYNTTVHYHSTDDEEDTPEKKRKVILDHLRYEHMERRGKAIYNVHDSAYQWAFQPLRTPLQTWLESAGGIFWVTGKAGAGKSTFMKFLAEHATTQQLLYRWATGRRLIIATHYFWYASAGELHSNIEGFLRSLLLAALCEFPETIEDVFPVRWSQNKHLRTSAWSETELSQAIHNLSKIPDVAFAFFIDGLDECVPSHEHGELVRALEKIAQHANIKLCVASRPWQIFETHFGSLVNRLELHTLTYPDMIAYIWTRLVRAEQDAGLRNEFQSSSADANMLAEYIAWKAEGVFLWASLVLKTMSQEIEAGRDVRSLQHYVDEVPVDLKKFFTTMIYERIDHHNHSTVAIVLKLASLLAGAARANYSNADFMSFLNFICLQRDHGIADTGFAAEIRVETVELEDLRSLLQQTRRYLGRLTRDLLHIPPNKADNEISLPNSVSGWVSLACIEVEFLHRSVYDYLLDPDMQVILNKYTPDHFKGPDFVARVTLARMKLIPPRSITWPSILGSSRRSLNQVFVYLNSATVHLSHQIYRLHSSATRAAQHADLDCLRATCSHLSIEFVREFETVVLRYYCQNDRLEVMWDYTLLNFLVSFGCTEYLAEASPGHFANLWEIHGPDLMREAISALFFDPTEPSHATAVIQLLQCRGRHRLNEQREPWWKLDRSWWEYLLNLWSKLNDTGELTTSTETMALGLTVELRQQLLHVVEALCDQGFDVIEEPRHYYMGGLPERNCSLVDLLSPEEAQYLQISVNSSREAGDPP